MSLGREAAVGVRGGDESEGEREPLGTVMNLEPSLFVYFAVFRGDAGVGAACFWLVAGIIRLPNAGNPTHQERVRTPESWAKGRQEGSVGESAKGERGAWMSVTSFCGDEAHSAGPRGEEMSLGGIVEVRGG